MQNTPERQLARDLCRKFGLLEARVVPGGEHDSATDYALLLKSYGRAAAEYFDELVEQAEDAEKTLDVSLSGGQTILDMVGCLERRRRPKVKYYADALIGRGKHDEGASHRTGNKRHDCMVKIGATAWPSHLRHCAALQH